MPSGSADHAGVLAPAPVMYGAAILVGLIAEYTQPLWRLPPSVSLWLGIATISASFPIVLFAVKALGRAQTAFDARKPTSRIVTDGAYRYSRNPTYISLTLLHIGIALVLGSLWVLLMVIPAVILTHWGVIRREERYLEAKFGHEYLRYKAAVRRARSLGGRDASCGSRAVSL